MEVYFVIFLISLYSLFAKKREREITFIVWALMFLTTILRAETIGADTYVYINHFNEEYRPLEFLTNIIYAGILGRNLDSRWTLVIFGVITYLPLYFIAKRFKVPLPYFLLFFFLYHHYSAGLNIMRNMAATSLTVLGISYIYDKRLVKSLLFFVFVILGAGIHTSVYVFLPLYLLRYLKITDRAAIVTTIIFSFLVMTKIISVNDIFLKYVPELYEEYIWRVMSSINTTLFGFIIALIALFAYSAIIGVLDKQKIPLYVISIIAAYSFFGNDANVFRIFQPLLMCRTIFIAKAANQLAIKDRLTSYQQLAIFYIVFFAIVTCYTGFANNKTLVPYRFFF